jgi:putative membrane protein
MTRPVRRLGSLSLILLGAQALALGALAQTPTDRTQPVGPTSTAERATNRAAAAATRSGMKDVTPQSFASQAAVLNKAEIELSQLALKNTKNEETRIFAERMIKDHTATGEKLKKVAQKQNISVPESLDAEHQATKQKLAALQGEAFDREGPRQGCRAVRIGIAESIDAGRAPRFCRLDAAHARESSRKGA